MECLGRVFISLLIFFLEFLAILDLFLYYYTSTYQLICSMFCSLLITSNSNKNLVEEDHERETSDSGKTDC
jgi:hypothetical protein